MDAKFTQKTFNVDEIAEIMMCDKDRVSERLISGDIPGVKFGRSWVIPSEAFFLRLNEIAIEESMHRRGVSAALPTPKPDTPKKRGRPRFTGSGRVV